MRYIILFLLLSACSSVRSETNNFYINDSSLNPLVADSLKYLGYNEQRNRRELAMMLGVDPVRTEWCAAFVNYVLEKNGHLTSADIHQYPLLARSFTEYGEEVIGTPQTGDIVVLTRGTQGWQGHVGFFLTTVTVNNKLHYAIVSGNDNDSVTIDTFPIHRVITVRRVE